MLTLLSSPSKFEKEQWKSRIRPTPEQLRDLRLNGWKSSRGKHGPNFFDWFKEEVILLQSFAFSNISIFFAPKTNISNYIYLICSACKHLALIQPYVKYLMVFAKELPPMAAMM